MPNVNYNIIRGCNTQFFYKTNAHLLLQRAAVYFSNVKELIFIGDIVFFKQENCGLRIKTITKSTAPSLYQEHVNMMHNLTDCL